MTLLMNEIEVWHSKELTAGQQSSLLQGKLAKLPMAFAISRLGLWFSPTLLHFVCASWSYVCMIISGNVGESYQIWQASCRRQGMLTQGPAPDPKSTSVGFHVWYCPLVAELYFCWKAGACVLCTCPSGSQILILQIKSQRKAADIAWCKQC